MSWDNIEDLYPLSPVQEGMLFHSLYEPDCGIYVSQISFTIWNLNAHAFKRAWQQVMDRQAILRTAFVWKNLGKPHQVVCRRVGFPLEEQNWVELSEEEQEVRFEALLSLEMRRGFQLNKAPLMSLKLIKVTDTAYRFIWSHHHILLDGWSIMLIFKEVITLYHAFCRGAQTELESPHPYREYIAWLQRQDISEAEGFWRESLKGFYTPTPLQAKISPEDSSGQLGKYGEHSLVISAETVAKLQSLVRRYHLTLNTLLQAAWALTLADQSGMSDVIFGVTVSDRPAELAGIESMVGLFINVLPMRVKVLPEVKLLSWLKALQEQQVSIQQYKYTPLRQIQTWSQLLRGTALFQSILSFENYPVEGSSAQQWASLGIHDFRWRTHNNYPLTVMVGTHNELTLRIVYQRHLMQEIAVSQTARQVQAFLNRFTDEPEFEKGNLKDLLIRAPSKPRTFESRDYGVPRFMKIQPKVVSLPQGKLIETSYLQPDQPLPLVIQPAVKNLDLTDWAKGNRAFIEGQLLKHGAILFRNFNVKSVAAFEECAQAVCPELFGEYGDLPREGFGGRVYGSTPYPQDKAILSHNESSHLRNWPLKIWFFCLKAAEYGGETPLVDCRKAYHLIPRKIIDRFEQKKIMYVRNYIEGLDVSWRDFFRTSDRSLVEEHCRKSSIDCQWIGQDRLQTRQVCQAVARHPRCGEMVFFNQIQLHHISCLDEVTRETLASLYMEEDFPRNVYYGDGSPIEDSVVSEIREVYRQVTIAFPWQEGDILMLDNMLTAHGRNPYLGSRKIAVVMGEMITE